jgi:hypothetical protein
VNHVITKGPTVLAIRCGVHDLVVLRALYSTWIVACPLLVWAAALWSLRRDALYWPFVALFCAIYFTTSFFAIGEYNLCFALSAYCFAVLVRSLPDATSARAALLIAALALSLCYPATLLSGSLLAMLAATTPAERGDRGASRGYRAVLVAALVASAATAAWEVIAPRDPGQFARARETDALFHDAQLWCTVLYLVAMTAMFAARTMRVRVALAIACGVLLVGMSIDTHRFPAMHYEVRLFAAVVLAAAGVGLWAWRRWLPARDTTPLVAAAGIALLATVAAFDVALSLDYARYLDDFRAAVNCRAGVVSYEDSGLADVPGDARFGWRWTYPVTSLVLRDGPGKAIIANPKSYRGWQPFDPNQQVPDLDRYYR